MNYSFSVHFVVICCYHHRISEVAPVTQILLGHTQLLQEFDVSAVETFSFRVVLTNHIILLLGVGRQMIQSRVLDQFFKYPDLVSHIVNGFGLVGDARSLAVATVEQRPFAVGDSTGDAHVGVMSQGGSTDGDWADLLLLTFNDRPQAGAMHCPGIISPEQVNDSWHQVRRLGPANHLHLHILANRMFTNICTMLSIVRD